MTFELPKLPYAIDALAPLISAETLEFHYGRHHRSYVDQLNRLVSGTSFSQSSLEEIVQKAEGALYNNAGQAWNHEFYWNSLSPPGSSVQLSPSFTEQVKKDFGSLDGLKASMRECALSAFGSGWAWLVKNEAGRLRVLSTSNAENPLRANLTPVLTCDIWEHAYYIDYRNERARYLDSCLKLMNMSFASQCFDRKSDAPPHEGFRGLASRAQKVSKNTGQRERASG